MDNGVEAMGCSPQRTQSNWQGAKPLKRGTKEIAAAV